MILGFHHEDKSAIVESGEYHIGLMSVRTPLNMPKDTLDEVRS